MIDFVCPGCLSTHSANEAFAGLRARCVVCGAAIVIPESSGEVATGWDLGSHASGSAGPMPSKPSIPASRSSRPVALDEEEQEENLEDLDELEEMEEIEEQEEEGAIEDDTFEESPPRVRKRPIASGEDMLLFNKLDDEELLGEDSESEPGVKAKKKKKKSKNVDSFEAPETTEAVTPLEEAVSAEERRKRQLRIGIAIVVTILCVSMAIYVAFFRGETPPKLEPPPPPPPKKEPPPKKVDPPPPPPVEPAPAPRPYRPTNQFTAASFYLERSADPAGFDKTYGDSYVIIQATHARTSPTGVITLAESSDDPTGIVCMPPKPRGPQPAATQPEPSAPVSASTALKPGQSVTIRGIYVPPLRLIESEVVKTGSAADAEYVDKDIEITGTVAQTNPDAVGERFPSVTLEPTTTDSPITIRCLFPVLEQEKISKLTPGQAVTIRGRCEGRLFRTVRLHNCSFVAPTDPPDPSYTRIASDQFFAAYEMDLLPAPRPRPETTAIPVSSEHLASAFETNLKLANANYRFVPVQVSGRILERRPSNRTIVLESRTNDRYQIVAAFSPANFAMVRNEKEVLVRGVCVGVRDVRFIRIENAELLALEPRLVAEFLPFEPGRELLYESLSPGKAKDNPITQLKVRMNDTDMIGTVAIRSGTFPGGTLFGDQSLQPRWTRDLTKLKVPPTPVISQHRLKDETIEIRPFPTPPIQPSPWWDPVLKLGCKKKESWSSEMPDGRTVTYTVLDFRKDETLREVVELRRVLKNPKVPNIWEESVITYVRGLGEVRRIVTSQTITGTAVAVMEMRLVESGIEGTVELSTKKEPEKKETDKKDGKP